MENPFANGELLMVAFVLCSAAIAGAVVLAIRWMAPGRDTGALWSNSAGPGPGNRISRPPVISMHQIRIGANIPGLIFTAGVLLIFLIGVPPVRVFMAVSLVAGGAVAIVLRLMRKQVDNVRHRGGPSPK